jgi:hypothetical protein
MSTLNTIVKAVKQLKLCPVWACLKMAEIIEIPQEELESALADWFKQAHANYISVDRISFRENGFNFLLVWE